MPIVMTLSFEWYLVGGATTHWAALR